MSTALQVQDKPQSIAAIWKTADLIIAQRDAIVRVMREAMRKDVDYGTIPGTPKPTLYKPGSEKLLSMFRLVGKPEVMDLSTPDMIRYQVRFIVTDQHGNFVGEGIGEASSAEAKYQWREAVCQEEWEETAHDRRRRKWKKGKTVPYSVLQLRADMEDIANTVLKMAKKRAQIDGTLTVTAASDVFSQDLEDLKDLGIDPDVAEGAAGEGDGQKAQPTELPKKENPPAQTQRQPAPAQQRAAGPVISDKQGRYFYAMCCEHNRKDEINAYLKNTFGIDRSDQIPANRFEEALKWAKREA